MLSTDYETKVRVNKKELLNCIDRATLLIRESDKKPIIIQIEDGEMRLKLTSGVGSMNEEIVIEKEGKDILIGFNPKFMIDALARHRRRNGDLVSGKSQSALLYPG